MLPIGINNRKEDGLIDTGASVSLIKESKLAKLGVTIDNSIKLQLVYGDGKRVPCKGIVHLKVAFENRIEDCCFHVVNEDFPRDIVLGKDWCQRMRLTMDFDNSVIKIGTKDNAYRLKQAAVIPAKHLMAVKVTNKKNKNDLMLIKPHRSNAERFRFFAYPGLTQCENYETSIC